MKPLNAQTVAKVIRPEKIIQFGEGNFLRGFVDWMVQSLNEKTTFNGSVVMVQPRRKRTIDRFIQQDGLYHVNLQGLTNGKVINSLTLIDSISRTLNPYSDAKAFVELATLPELAFVVSNTTEAGIVYDPSCQLEDMPAESYPGKLTQLLYRRFTYFKGDMSKGLTIIPCELIFHNGVQLKQVIQQYIDQWQLGTAFQQWFTMACPVYSSLVDRIVTGFPSQDIETIQERLGFEDNLVVRAEPYYLWVIEAPETLYQRFPVDKAKLSVHCVPDEQPFHQRKVTLLNGAHTLLSPVSAFYGIPFVRDACKEAIMGSFIRQSLYQELSPSLPMPKPELDSYIADVLTRFENPFIDHQVTAIMLNAFAKLRARELPSLLAYVTQNHCLPQRIVLGFAATFVYYKGGLLPDGSSIEVKDDPQIKALCERLWTTKSIAQVVYALLCDTSLWGQDLTKLPDMLDLTTSFATQILHGEIKKIVNKLS